MKHLASVAAGIFVCLTVPAPNLSGQTRIQSSEPRPVAQLGAKAGAQYHGDGLSVLATPQGARLRCVFQKLEGEVTTEGLWLTSTVDGAKGDRFRVIATSAGREADGGVEGPPRRGDMSVACA